MLTEERKRHLLDTLRSAGRIVAKDSAATLGTSEDTIRRDLRELAAEGLLMRVHGGALPASRAVENLAARRTISTSDKLVLARLAAGLVEAGKVIFVDGGTTALELARCIGRDLRLTVVTHSPLVAAEFADHRAEVQLIGGRLFKHSMVAVGAAAAEAIRAIRTDIYFMGVTGVHPEYGLTTGDAEEAVIKRTIAQCAAEVVVMASREKLGAVSPFSILPADSMVRLIVPADVVPKSLREYWKRGVETIQAKAGHASA